MSNNTARKLPRWKSLLFYAAVLVGLPVTGWAMGEHHHLLAAIAGIATVAGVVISFSVKRCPNCRERLLTISYPTSHCPKCGTPYQAAEKSPKGAKG